MLFLNSNDETTKGCIKSYDSEVILENLVSTCDVTLKQQTFERRFIHDNLNNVMNIKGFNFVYRRNTRSNTPSLSIIDNLSLCDSQISNATQRVRGFNFAFPSQRVLDVSQMINKRKTRHKIRGFNFVKRSTQSLCVSLVY